MYRLQSKTYTLICYLNVTYVCLLWQGNYHAGAGSRCGPGFEFLQNECMIYTFSFAWSCFVVWPAVSHWCCLFLSLRYFWKPSSHPALPSDTSPAGTCHLSPNWRPQSQVARGTSVLWAKPCSHLRNNNCASFSTKPLVALLFSSCTEFYVVVLSVLCFGVKAGALWLTVVTQSSVLYFNMEGLHTSIFVKHV